MPSCINLYCTRAVKECDRLSLVTYDTNVYLDFSLTSMSTTNKDKTKITISKLREGSSTNLCGGLVRGILCTFSLTIHGSGCCYKLFSHPSYFVEALLYICCTLGMETNPGTTLNRKMLCRLICYVANCTYRAFIRVGLFRS